MTRRAAPRTARGRADGYGVVVLSVKVSARL